MFELTCMTLTANLPYLFIMGVNCWYYFQKMNCKIWKLRFIIGQTFFIKIKNKLIISGFITPWMYIASSIINCQFVLGLP